MRNFVFWQNWLFYSSLLFACWGLLLAIDPDSFIFKWYNRALIAQLFGTAEPKEVAIYRSFIAGPLGGTIAGFYLLTAFIAGNAFKKKEMWAWNSIALSFGVWALIDCAVALHHRAYFHIYILNGLSILVKVLPLAFTWNAFRQVNKSHI